ncbi:MAG: DUF1640 domain-containing protein [Candidatus Methylumidiphilus alinenensis]|uniref:DUF1640 domain-containing protein n=1 Tax=Candidatus Methylumidiphilus alinenensis TaxID=2202197 RepID=A0A2W4RMG0_9GAMM|nr:MAG: DUF1640 domain-containing protein [Candidatus Methylumidiphilus alinenensis]
MATITFDTLKFVEKLRAAGVPEAQAKAEAEALQGVFAETPETQLATKTDIVRLERRLDGFDAKIDRLETKLSGELTLVKWMMGLVLGGVIALIMRAFFPA